MLSFPSLSTGPSLFSPTLFHCVFSTIRRKLDKEKTANRAFALFNDILASIGSAALLHTVHHHKTASDKISYLYQILSNILSRFVYTGSINAAILPLLELHYLVNIV